MRVSILQSNYLPWKGYFDIILKSDVFIFHDDLQYTKNDWRNRNQIKTHNGLDWITIPCGTDTNRLICEVEIKSTDWQQKHWNKISASYRKAPYFEYYRDFFYDFYHTKSWTNLSELNQFLIKHIVRHFLKYDVEFMDSRQFHLGDLRASKRVVELLKRANATTYISGPSAKNYLVESDFKDAKIELEYMDYSQYPEYPQLHGSFVHGVSIIDMLFNCGDNVRNLISLP